MQFSTDHANAGQYGFGLVSWPHDDGARRVVYLVVWRWCFVVTF